MMEVDRLNAIKIQEEIEKKRKLDMHQYVSINEFYLILFRLINFLNSEEQKLSLNKSKKIDRIN